MSNCFESDMNAPMKVRAAAHIAYALHNEAEVFSNGADFNLEQAFSKVGAIDQVLGDGVVWPLLSQLDRDAEPSSRGG